MKLVMDDKKSKPHWMLVLGLLASTAFADDNFTDDKVDAKIQRSNGDTVSGRRANAIYQGNAIHQGGISANAQRPTTPTNTATQTDQPLTDGLNLNGGINNGGINDDTKSTQNLPIARLNSDTAPVGLSSLSPNIEALLSISGSNNNDINNNGVIDPEKLINPEDYLPQYTRSDDVLATPIAINDTVDKSPNVLVRLYNRFFNDGVQTSPHLTAKVYLNVASLDLSAPPTAIPLGNSDPNNDRSNNESWLSNTANDLPNELSDNANDSQKVTDIFDIDDVADFAMDTPSPPPSKPVNERLSLADTAVQPYKNMAAVLEDMTVDSIVSFSQSLPKLKDAVQSAAQAVGFYETQFRLQNAGNGQINIIIDKLGEPVKVASSVVQVRGAQDIAEIERAKMLAEEQINGVFNHETYRLAKQRLDGLHSDLGFFDGRWLDSSAEIVLPDNTADVSLIYDANQRYVFDEVVFFTLDKDSNELTTDPNKLPVDSRLLKQLLTFKTGDGFDRRKVLTLTNDLIGTGYFNTSNVELVLPEAPPVDSSPVQPALNTTSDGGVQTAISPIDFRPSERLTSQLQAVKDKANRLYNSPNDRILLDNDQTKATSLLGQVSDVIKNLVQKILPDETGDVASDNRTPPTPLPNRKTPLDVLTDKKVPLYVFVMADKPKQAQIGLGWGSDTGARATARFENNLINKQGLQAQAELAISPSEQSVDGYLSYPLSHPVNDKLIATGKYLQEKINQQADDTLTTQTLEAGLVRQQVGMGDWNMSYGLRYRLDRLNSNLPSDAYHKLPLRFSAGSTAQQAVLAGLSLSQTVQDNLANPMQGYRHHYSLEAGSKSLGSDTTMAIVRAGVSGMYSFGDNAYGKNRAHQLLGRLDAGYLWAEDFFAVPYKLRFFAGGDQSIRGYSPQSLAPVSDNGYLVGGQILAVGSAEYNYEVKEGLRAAIFADVGGAYDKHFSNKTNIGAGVGIRWASPVGVLRVDAAKAIQQDGSPIRLHFLIGLPF